MQIEIKLDENCKEPKIIVVTNKMTDEINEIMKRLSDEQPKMIAGFKDDIVEVLEPFDIYRIFAASGNLCHAFKWDGYLCFKAFCRQDQTIIRNMRW